MSVSWVINGSDCKPGAIKNSVAVNIGTWAFVMSLSYMSGASIAGLLGPEKWKEAHLISAGVCFIALLYVTFIDQPINIDQDVKPIGLDIIIKQNEYRALVGMNFSCGVLFTGGLVAASIGK